MNQKIKKIILLLGDIAILYTSLWLTLLIRYRTEYGLKTYQEHLLPFSIVFIIWLIVFYITELYEFDYHRRRIVMANKLIMAGVISGVLAVAFFYFGYNRLFTIKPQRVLLINLIIVLFLLYLWRELFFYLIKSRRLANNLVIIGFNPLVAEVIREIYQKPQLGFQIKTFINPESNQSLIDSISSQFKDIDITNNLDNLKNICLEKKINAIVSAIHPRQNPILLKNLFTCLPLKISFFDLATFYEKITGKIPVSTIEQVWFLENLTESSKKLYEILKRVFDIILAITLLIFSLPFLPLIALMIKLDSQGPVFFTQIRVGKEGRNFLAIKLRTMRIGAEKNGPQWAQKDDPRVTRVGKFLRKTRIDEIPQLLNVLRGEMSLIGPRPERPEFVEQLQNQIPFYKERLLIKPGLTGWAQIIGPAYGGSKEESLEKLQYDLFYIKNRSLALDLVILLKTVKIILSRKGV